METSPIENKKMTQYRLPEKAQRMLENLDRFMGGATHKYVKQPNKNAVSADSKELSETDRDKVDGQLMAASSALMIALISLVDKSKSVNNFVFLIAAFLFLMSFLIFLWNQYRMRIRRRLYLEKQDKWNEESGLLLAKHATLVAELTSLRAKVYIYEHLEEIENIDLEKVYEKIHAHSIKEGEYDYLADMLAHTLSAGMKQNFQTSFNEPLLEKYSGWKNLIEKFTRVWRYRIFFFALMLFAIAIITQLAL